MDKNKKFNNIINLLIFILSLFNIILIIIKYNIKTQQKNEDKKKEDLNTVLLITTILIILLIIALFLSIIISLISYIKDKNPGYILLIVFHLIYIYILISHLLKEENDKTKIYNELFILASIILMLSSIFNLRQYII